MSRTIVLCSALALCCAAACREATARSSDPHPPAPPVRITRAAVVEAPTPDVITLTGRLAADQRAEVTADTQGKVTAVLVRRGQHVRRGQPIVRLDVRVAALRAREADAQLSSTRAQADLAAEECARARMLVERGAITKSEADQAQARCASAGSQVRAASARAHVLARGVSDGIVRAPFDGVVAERSVAAGEWVVPGRPLLTLVDADPLTIELSVPEADVHLVRPGQPVTLAVIAAPGATYRATVSRVGAEIGRSRSLIVEATLAPAPDLVPGMFAEASIVVGHTARPVVPRTAAVRRGDDWHVFVVHPTELEDRIVRLGPAPGPDRVAVVENLAKGDVVVRAPTPETRDGLTWAEQE